MAGFFFGCWLEAAFEASGSVIRHMFLFDVAEAAALDQKGGVTLLLLLGPFACNYKTALDVCPVGLLPILHERTYRVR